MMPWWAWAAGGFVAYVWVWRSSFRWMMEDDRDPSWGDFWGIAICSALLFWLVAIFRLHDCLAHRITPKDLARVVAGESRKARRSRRERESREREERIREAERELGINV